MSASKPYNQLTAMLAIARASFRSSTRSPSAVVFTLAFPLIFIVVFGFIGGGIFSVHVGVHADCDRNNPVYAALSHTPVVRLDTSLSEVQMREDLSKGRIDALLTIRKNPGDTLPRYTVFTESTNASRDMNGVLKSVLNNVFYSLDAELVKRPTYAELKEKEVTIREYKRIDFILPGQLGFALLSSGVFGTAFVFLNLRQTLVIKRFFATPIRRPYIVLGEALSRLVFALTGAVIIIVLGHFAFGFTLVHGLLTVGSMLLLSALGLIVFMGFGFVVSGIARNESAVPPIANIITLPQFLLSGTFFSISVFPSWLQPICKVLPLTYLNDAMRKIAFEGASLADVGVQVGILFLWGIGIYALAVKTFRWE
jgi:ABC-2 type transport system permease protein